MGNPMWGNIPHDRTISVDGSKSQRQREALVTVEKDKAWADAIAPLVGVALQHEAGASWAVEGPHRIHGVISIGDAYPCGYCVCQTYAKSIFDTSLWTWTGSLFIPPGGYREWKYTIELVEILAHGEEWTEVRDCNPRYGPVRAPAAKLVPPGKRGLEVTRHPLVDSIPSDYSRSSHSAQVVPQNAPHPLYSSAPDFADRIIRRDSQRIWPPKV